MKKISADFEIIDNCNMPYSSSIEIINPQTSNVMQEIKNKIKSIYKIGLAQIKSISNIETQY